MRLFTIDDDFDMMLVFYFSIKQFKSESVEFWVKIYEHDECVSLKYQKGNFNVMTQGFEWEKDKNNFYCEFNS